MGKRPVLRLLILLISFLIIDSCTQEALRSEFIENVKEGDTLTLFAMFADCGEWGGHIEKIYLTKKGNNFYVNFYKDSVSCKTDPNDTRGKIMERSQRLSLTNRYAIVNYINKLKIASKIDLGISNSCDFYQISCKDSIIEYRDYGENWKEFKIMRDQIFK